MKTEQLKNNASVIDHSAGREHKGVHHRVYIMPTLEGNTVSMAVTLSALGGDPKWNVKLFARSPDDHQSKDHIEKLLGAHGIKTVINAAGVPTQLAIVSPIDAVADSYAAVLRALSTGKDETQPLISAEVAGTVAAYEAAAQAMDTRSPAVLDPSQERVKSPTRDKRNLV